MESLIDQMMDFSEDLWGSLAVYAKGDLRFMLACEVEITGKLTVVSDSCEAETG